MQDQATISRSPSYLVPCVFKAVRMIEALRESRVGLRVEDFLGMTGYSRSTIYRILRTLTACSYMVREPAGVYRLNPTVIRVADHNADAFEDCRPDSPIAAAKGVSKEFERWGVRFGSDGKRLALIQRGSEIPSANHSKI